MLYALSAADLTMLAALVFVLARNIIKLVVERRRALPFARFRAKLVALLLGMTLVPAVLVLIVGSELIRTNIDRWFNAPMEDILSSANQIAGDYYHERQMLVSDQASRIAWTWPRVDLGAADLRPIRDLLAPDVTLQRVQMVAVYLQGRGSARSRIEAGRGRRGDSKCRPGTAAPPLSAWRRRHSPGEAEPRSVEALGSVGRSPAFSGGRQRKRWQGHRRGRRHRLPDRRSRGALAPHDGTVREIQPAQSAGSCPCYAFTCRFSSW